MKIEPILGRPFCWQVQSQSAPSTYHLVNWLGDSLAGGPTCSCTSWAMNNRRAQQEGKPFLCRHLLAAKEHCWQELLESVREQILSQ
jgi:hypothetical protein